MKPNMVRACITGFAGTILITLMTSFVSPYMSGGPMDIASIFGGLLGGSWLAGMIAHLLTGTFILPIVYVVFLNPRLAGGAAARGMTWGLILWSTSQAIVMPTIGWGFFSSQAGGLTTVVDSLIGHLVYGLFFGVLVGGPAVMESRGSHGFGSAPQARRVG